MVKNETIQNCLVLVAVCRQDVWDETQERLLGRRGGGTDGHVVSIPPDQVAYIPDRRLDLGREKSNAEVACGSNGNGDRLWFLFKEAFTEPNTGELEREIKVEQ